MEAKTIQALEKAQLDPLIVNSLTEQNHHRKSSYLPLLNIILEV